MQVTINELQKKNTLLQSQLSEQKQSHFSNKYVAERNEFVVNELKFIFNLENTDDILIKVRDIMSISRNNRVKEEVPHVSDNHWVIIRCRHCYCRVVSPLPGIQTRR